MYAISNTELMEKVKGKDISELYPNINKEADLNSSGLTEELSSEEIDRFKDHGYDLLQKLDMANDSGDHAQIEDAKTKLDNYRSHLLNIYGIKTTISNDRHDIYFKPLFRANKEHEKIRQLIKNQTNKAMKDFNEQMPMLKMHLNRSINPKLVKSTYTPETHFSWYVSM